MRKENKKVMIVLPHLRTGGGEHLALDEAVYLRNYCNMDVRVISLKPIEDNMYTKYADELGLDVIYLNKCEHKLSLNIFVELVRVMHEFHPDVLSTHLQVMPYVLLPSLILGIRKKYHTIHTIAEKEATGLLRKIENFAFTYCGFVPIAISPYCQTTITKLYGLKKENVPIIYNGIDIQKYSCSIPYESRDTNIIRIISTGRFESVKRHDLMLKCFKRVHSQYPKTQLIFLGDGKERSNIEKLVDILELQEAVILKGMVSNVSEELNKAHIFLMASDYEGLPLSLLEAMSCGLPVVSTKAGGAIDIVPKSVGLLCNCNNEDNIVNALNTLIMDKVLRQQMSRNATDYAKNFSMNKCSSEYAKLFQM